MASYTFDANSMDRLGAHTMRLLRRYRGGAEAAMRLAAREGVGIVKQTSRQPVMIGGIFRRPVDMGVFVSRWNAVGTSVINDAPHAPFVEHGTRPHPVSREGREALRDWVIRKLSRETGVRDGRTSQAVFRQSHDEWARGVAWAIATKISREGTEPYHVIPRSRAALQRAGARAVTVTLRRLSRGRA